MGTPLPTPCRERRFFNDGRFVLVVNQNKIQMAMYSSGYSNGKISKISKISSSKFQQQLLMMT